MRAITYGFFEPMFFFGLGLYFVRVDYGIAILGLGLLALAMSIKFVLGSQMARLIRVDGLRNFFAIAHEGGVDGAIMLTALQLGLVGGGLLLRDAGDTPHGNNSAPGVRRQVRAGGATGRRRRSNSSGTSWRT